MSDVASFFPTAQIGLHVAISLAGIVAGVVAVVGLLGNRRPDAWTAVFLWTTSATSFSGFFLPAEKVLPSHVVGVVSLVVLAVALYALHACDLAGGWRRAFVISAVAALYLNVFVLVAQSFQKVSALHALAPTQSEPPFAVAQGAVLLVFVALGTVANSRFRPTT
jgi:hypothetical protein